MKKRLSILVALVLTMVMSISVALADYPVEGTITIPAASAVGKNWISSNLRSAYAQTSGSTNTYVSVTATFYYISPSEGADDETVIGSASIYIRKTPVYAPSDSRFYKVVSTHKATYGENTGRVDLTNEP